MSRDTAFWVHMLLANFWGAVWWFKPGLVPAVAAIIALLLASLFGLARSKTQPSDAVSPRA